MNRPHGAREIPMKCWASSRTRARTKSARLPQARRSASSRSQSRQQGGRGAIQGNRGRQRHVVGQGQARALRPRRDRREPAPNGRGPMPIAVLPKARRARNIAPPRASSPRTSTTPSLSSGAARGEANGAHPHARAPTAITRSPSISSMPSTARGGGSTCCRTRASTSPFPAGVRDGHVLRLEEQGGAGLGGGPPGDALIEIHVAPHPVFRREGDDIHLDLPVTVGEAVLGGRVTVPTPTGAVTMTIPPGIPIPARRCASKARACRVRRLARRSVCHAQSRAARAATRNSPISSEWAPKHPYDPRAGWRRRDHLRCGLRRSRDLEAAELERWIAERWVLPERQRRLRLPRGRCRPHPSHRRDEARSDDRRGGDAGGAQPARSGLCAAPPSQAVSAAIEALPPEIQATAAIAHLERGARMSMIVGLLLHILAAVVWVGGMFFAHQMLRPSPGRSSRRALAAVGARVRALLSLGLGLRRRPAGQRLRHVRRGVAEFTSTSCRRSASS